MSIAALQIWLRVQCVGWTAWLVATAWFGSTARPSWWATAQVAAMALSYASLLAVLRAGRRAADAVTVLRFVLLLNAVLLADRGVTWAWLVATAAVLLDLADGAVARRFGGSPAGAVLDMETDQLTVLALAAMVTAAGGGAHVLVLPALRYAFVLAMWWVGAPAHDPKPKAGDNRRGRLVCAAVMTALLLALCPVTPSLGGDVLTAVAVALLCWSFADDAKFLLAHRRAMRERA